MKTTKKSKIAKNLTYLFTMVSCLSFFGCGEYFTGYNPDFYFLNDEVRLEDVGRVAVLEFKNKTLYEDISKSFSSALVAELRNQHLFGINYVKKEDDIYRQIPSQRSGEYSLKQLGSMRKLLESDAVLTGTVTHHKPWPNMELSVNLRLISLNDGSLIWAAENVWLASDKSVQDRIGNYYFSQSDPSHAPWYQKVSSRNMHERLATVSAFEFSKYAAYELVRPLKYDK